jgi:hypothetical protein
VIVDELPQSLTAARHPGHDGADRDAEQGGHFVIAQTLRDDEEQNLALLVGPFPTVVSPAAIPCRVRPGWMS